MAAQRGTTLLVGGLAAIALAGLWWNAAHPDAGPQNIVVITLDTTRADRLSPYGFMNVTLPSLERLAREGVVFDHATSVAPLTLPAHTSLFTGLLPPNHGVRDNADAPLPESQTTMAEALSARGFRTGAFVASVVLDSARGLRQGFEQYGGVDTTGREAARGGDRRADAVMDDAIRWLDTVAGSRFFLWAHLYDAHRPYDPPEPYATTYAHNPYIGEIAFVDSQIGRLLEALERRRLLDRTLVVVTGDHGESLGEHGERDHGIFVYESVLQVPLIVRAPGLRPTRIGEVVRLTDVMPTVLDMLGIASPPGDGVSLVDLMSGRRRDLNLDAYSESLYPERLGWSPLHALRQGRFKLIDAPRPELYDLENDPFEEHDIFNERRTLAGTMMTRITTAAKGRGSETADGRLSDATPEWQARLGALGYLASTMTRDASNTAARPDPKDCIGAFSGDPTWISVSPACGPPRRALER